MRSLSTLVAPHCFWIFRSKGPAGPFVIKKDHKRDGHPHTKGRKNKQPFV